MGMMDKLNDMKEKAKNLAGEHGDKVRQGMDKAGEFADKQTGGKYSDKIDKGVQKGKEGLDKVAQDKDQGGGTPGDSDPGGKGTGSP